MTDIQQPQNSRPRPSIGRFAGIMAVFLGAGPPIGGLAVGVLLAAMAAGSDLSTDGWPGRGRMFLGTMMLVVTFGLPLSYIIGGVPALLIGFATATWDAAKGALSLRVALGCAVVLGCLAALRQGDPVWASEGERFAQVAMLLAHLSSAGLCLLLARAIFGKPGRSGSSGQGETE